MGTVKKNPPYLSESVLIKDIRILIHGDALVAFLSVV